MRLILKQCFISLYDTRYIPTCFCSDLVFHYSQEVGSSQRGKTHGGHFCRIQKLVVYNQTVVLSETVHFKRVTFVQQSMKENKGCR